MGPDPHRHGRFTTIVERREKGLYRAGTRDALFPIPIDQLFRTRYDDIHHHWLLFKRYKKASKPQKSYI